MREFDTPVGVYGEGCGSLGRLSAGHITKNKLGLKLYMGDE